MPGNGNKRQRPNPRPDLKRGRDAEERAVRRAARPRHTKMNTRSKRRLEALSRRYPDKLELRVPQPPRGHACHPAYTGANRSAVR